MRKRFLGIILTMAAALSITACGGSGSAQTATSAVAAPESQTDGNTAGGNKADGVGAEESRTEETRAEDGRTEENKTEGTRESAASDGTVKKILWTHAGDLGAQKGSDKNIGTAGLLNGVSGGYVIAGGGANFPQGGPETGGPKVYYPDLYVMKPEDGSLTLVNHTTMGYEIGYGASITAPEGIYYIGGSPVEGKGDKIMLVKADEKGEVTLEEIGKLPFTFSDGAAVLKDRVIYVGAGKQDGKASNKFYAFDLDTKETTELAPVPGEETRTQCVSQVLDGRIYVFSGGDAVAYTDGYSYDIEKDQWEKAADIAIEGRYISLLGAGSVKISDTEMLVIGGFDKEVYDNAVAKMAELKDDALAEFKMGYFGADPSELKWNKKILIYNARENAWSTVGEVPFDAPCGEGLVLNGDYIYSINGEIKPGTRTSRMYGGMLVR